LDWILRNLGKVAASCAASGSESPDRSARSTFRSILSLSFLSKPHANASTSTSVVSTEQNQFTRRKKNKNKQDIQKKKKRKGLPPFSVLGRGVRRSGLVSHVAFFLMCYFFPPLALRRNSNPTGRARKGEGGHDHDLSSFHQYEEQSSGRLVIDGARNVQRSLKNETETHTFIKCARVTVLGPWNICGQASHPTPVPHT
jgi:hypothetical protein